MVNARRFVGSVSLRWQPPRFAGSLPVPLAGAVAAAAGLVACQPTPQTFLTEWSAALQSGKAESILPLVTRESRPLVGALLASGAQGLVPAIQSGAVAVEGLEPDPAMDVGQGYIVQVRAKGDRTGPVRDWVLVREDGALRLDLQATALRRPWGKAGRPGSLLDPPVAAPEPDSAGEPSESAAKPSLPKALVIPSQAE